MPIGDEILALDYNAIRDKVISIMGVGYSQRGYGQALNSVAAGIGATITQEIWDDLRLDLVNTFLHQTGTQRTDIVIPQVGQVIKYGSAYPVTSYDTLADEAYWNRFSIGTNRSLITAKEEEFTTNEWLVRAFTTATVTFDTVDKARHFFNAGGKIRFYSSCENVPSTPGNSMWNTFLEAAGLVEFGANTPTDVTYYELTNNFQVVNTFYDIGTDPENPPPEAAYYQVTAKCNVTDNSAGTATQVTFGIEWKNGWGSGGIYGPYAISPIDGKLTLFMDELKGTGPLFPSGTFTIASPIYDIQSIQTES